MMKILRSSRISINSILKFPFAIRKTPTISEVQSHWDQFSSNYNKFDYCPQTFYYSLLYMMEVWEANNILEVACGTGKLLPIALSLKNPNANYLATDLSPKMMELTRSNLKANLERYNSSLSFEEWLTHNKLRLLVANSERPLDKPAGMGKFDRIICNCVLMLTSDAEAMLRNLHSEADKGCLLGVSVWGNKSNNNLMTSIRDSFVEAKVELPDERSNFYLYKKVPDLAQKCGWETVLRWEQNALFPALSGDSNKYGSFLLHHVQKVETRKQPLVKEILLKKIAKFFDEKRGLDFSCELMILRKK